MSAESQQLASTYRSEVEAGQRFEFGANWSRYLRLLDDSRIRRAEQSLCEMLEISTPHGKSFVDIGCGSGAVFSGGNAIGRTRRLFY